MRFVKSGDYSMISNFHLKDPRLSLSAKGLLSTMLAFSGEYSIDELEGLCSHEIYSTFAELEKYGYLTWIKVGIKIRRGVEGESDVLEYTIYEKPISQKISSDPIAEIMNPEDMPGSLKHIDDEEEKQKLRERLAVGKLEESYQKDFVELVFRELCRRDADFRKWMTQKAFERVCIMVMDQQEELCKQDLKSSAIETFRWTLVINEAFDNIEKGFRQKIPKINREVIERNSRKE